MNIYAEENDKVIFAHPTNGWDGDKETANKHLEVDKVYTIEYTEVGGCHTDVYLKEIPDVAFNSVMFEDYAEIELYEHFLVADGVAIQTHKVTMDDDGFWFKDGTYFPTEELKRVHVSKEGRVRFVSLNRDKFSFRNSLLSMIADIN